MNIRSLIVMLFCAALPVLAAKIPIQVKKSVAFIFVKDSANGLAPVGTGFFVLMSAQQNGDTANFGYLVTSKGTIRRPGGPVYDSLYLRINRRDGFSDTLIIPMKQNGQPRYFVHQDSTVDLAIIPAYPDMNRYDFLFTPVNMIAPVDFLKQESVTEGDELFTTGMFAGYVGQFKNIPSVRFSRMIQFSEEKYLNGPVYAELYLIDAPYIFGSSGSPLYFFAAAAKDTGSSVIPAKFFLTGILSGRLMTRSGMVNEVTTVTPAYKLLEMMNASAVMQEREREFLRRQQGMKK